MAKQNHQDEQLALEETLRQLEQEQHDHKQRAYEALLASQLLASEHELHEPLEITPLFCGTIH